jgi:hypothetical protein
MLAAAAFDRVGQGRQPLEIIKASRVGEIVRFKESASLVFLDGRPRNAKMQTADKNADESKNCRQHRSRFLEVSPSQKQE